MLWTVLYVAFGIVALWLLGEVLLQYKARLRWRLLAFFGFLGVVLGVLMPSVVVIAVGTAAFAAGQTFVTLSFRKGFETGWALDGVPGMGPWGRRDRSPAEEPADAAEAGSAPGNPATEPAHPAGRPAPDVPAAPEGTADDTAQFPVHGDPQQRPGTVSGYDPNAGYQGYGEGYGAGSYESSHGYGYGGYQTAAYETPAYETAAYETAAYETPAYETPAYETAAHASDQQHIFGWQPHSADQFGQAGSDAYGYPGGQHPYDGHLGTYAAATDAAPEPGTQADAYGPYASYNQAYIHGQYDQSQYADGYATGYDATDPYTAQQPYYPDSSSGPAGSSESVWVPQQRSADPAPAYGAGDPEHGTGLPPEQQNQQISPYPGDYYDYDEGRRY